MDTRYLPLLALDIGHGFFAGGRGGALHCRPSRACAALLARHDAVVRDTGHGLWLHVEARALDGLRDAAAQPGGLRLLWWLLSDDPLFVNYTDGLALPGGELPVFGNADGRAGGALEPVPALAPLEQHEARWASGGARLPAAAVALTLDARALAAADAPAAGPNPDALAPLQFTLALAARRTVWKYCLVGDWEAEPLQVVDLQRAVQFEPAMAEPLADGRQALAIRSTEPLMLQQRASRRFQLRGGSAHRVLVKRLPEAHARHFGRDTRPGAQALVSEIFVHR